jgi:hypothetical protein
LLDGCLFIECLLPPTLLAVHIVYHFGFGVVFKALG